MPQNPKSIQGRYETRNSNKISLFENTTDVYFYTIKRNKTEIYIINGIIL